MADSELKIKLRGIGENYANIKISYMHQKAIKELQSKKDISILKSDKGRALVIMDKTIYIYMYVYMYIYIYIYI